MFDLVGSRVNIHQHIKEWSIPFRHFPRELNGAISNTAGNEKSFLCRGGFNHAQHIINEASKEQDFRHVLNATKVFIVSAVAICNVWATSYTHCKATLLKIMFSVEGHYKVLVGEPHTPGKEVF